MPSRKPVYEPMEDSALLERYVRKYAIGKVLDVGTGSGIQAIAAAQNEDVENVLAIDVQKDVIDYCKKNIKHEKIKFLQSDLFNKVRGKFDTIIFNPPYLPQELRLKDLTIEGGKRGYEIIEIFLGEVNNFLNSDGIILIIFSSLTNKKKAEELIKKNLLEFQELDKLHIFFEDIYVYILKKNELLKKLENKSIKNLKLFAKGHRGVLYRGNYKNTSVIVKIKNPESAAMGRIENESKWLQKLNMHNIGPKILFVGNDYFVYRRINGVFIEIYLNKSSKKNIKKIIRAIFDQLFTLDNLKIDKEEMHHPVKHIIISKHKPFLIDFERSNYSQHPKNVTQFCQFVISGKISRILNNKKIFVNRNKIIELAKLYKNNQTKKNLNKIIGII